MYAFNSCREAVHHCIEEKTFSVAYLFREEKTMQPHVHDCCELYYSIAGGKKFLIGEHCYDVRPGDLFAISQYETHYLKQVDTMTHERIVFSIYPAFLKSLSSPQTDLTACFRHSGKDWTNRLHLDRNGQKRFVYYAHKITNADGFGNDLLARAALTELLVMINRKYAESRPETPDQGYRYNQTVADLIHYLNRHITEPLTLDSLSAHFFMSKSYLCRIFKAETGTTVKKYLTARRISIAKVLLAEGHSVSEACEQSGFNDYVNFVKSFTKLVGIPPKRYSLGCAS